MNFIIKSYKIYFIANLNTQFFEKTFKTKFKQNAEFFKCKSKNKFQQKHVYGCNLMFFDRNITIIQKQSVNKKSS